MVFSISIGLKAKVLVDVDLHLHPILAAAAGLVGQS